MSAPTLPDFALTAYCAGGESALAPLVVGGLLPPGEYICPRCEGSGGEWHPHPSTGAAEAWPCGECWGIGAVDLVADGIAHPEPADFVQFDLVGFELSA
jgi:hypothetical protein